MLIAVCESLQSSMRHDRWQAGDLLSTLGLDAHFAAAHRRGLFSVSRSRAAVARQSHKLRVDGSIPSSATNSSPPVVIQSWTASAVLFCLGIGSAILCVKTIGLMPGVLGYRDFS